MKYKAKILILLFALAFFCNGAFCYTLTRAELNKTLVSKITQETKNTIKDAKIKVKIISGLPNSNILTNDELPPQVELSTLSGFYPMCYRRVVVKDNQKNIVQMFNINVQTLLYQDILVASDNILYGADITSSNTKIENREISKFYDKIIKNLDEDYVSAKNIQKDSPILKNAIKKKALISKNSEVDIVFLSSKGLSVRISGKALKEGALGDTIPVRSDKYNKIYSAKVETSRKVTVRI